MLSGKAIPARRKPGYQHRARSEKRGAITKGYRYACHGPKQANNCAGKKIADTIDRRQHAERHAVVRLANEFCAQRNFQRLLDAEEYRPGRTQRQASRRSRRACGSGFCLFLAD